MRILLDRLVESRSSGSDGQALQQAKIIDTSSLLLQKLSDTTHGHANLSAIVSLSQRNMDLIAAHQSLLGMGDDVSSRADNPACESACSALSVALSGWQQQKDHGMQMFSASTRDEDLESWQRALDQGDQAPVAAKADTKKR